MAFTVLGGLELKSTLGLKNLHRRELDLDRLLIRQRHNILTLQGVSTARSASPQPTLCKDTLLDRNRDLRG